MARPVRLTLEEVLERVLESDGDYSESNSSEEEWSEEEEEPCERQSLLFCSDSSVDKVRTEVGLALFLLCRFSIYFVIPKN